MAGTHAIERRLAARDDHGALGSPPPQERPHPNETWKAWAFPVVSITVLLALTAIGSNFYVEHLREKRIEALMGPAPNLSRPLTNSYRIGGGREVDMTVYVEFAGRKYIDIFQYRDRIFDRLTDRFADIPGDRFEGTAGAEFVKESVEAAVRSEVPKLPVRGILIEKLTVK